MSVIVQSNLRGFVCICLSVLFVGVAAVACGCLGSSPFSPGDGNTTLGNQTAVPVSVPPPPPRVIKYGPAISAGLSHCLALCENGTVIAWGTANDGNMYGQCDVPPGLTNVTAIAAGWWHSTALLENGSVVAWGGTNWLEKVDVPVGLTNVTAISAGEGHNLALLGNGTVVVWGGRGFHDAHGLTNVMAISAGHLHSLALLRNGSVVAWGNNESGACDVPAGLTNVTAIAAGCGLSSAALENGTVVTWGEKWSASKGVPIWYLDVGDVKAISAGGGVEVVLNDGTAASLFLSDGKVHRWDGARKVKAISLGPAFTTMTLFEDDTVSYTTYLPGEYYSYSEDGIARWTTRPSCQTLSLK